MKNIPFLFLFFFVSHFALIANFSQAAETYVPPSAEAVLAEEVHENLAKKVEFVLFDARSRESYEAEHIEGAALPLTQEYYNQQALFRANVISTPPDTDAALKQLMQPHSRDTKIITYCNKDCHASQVLAQKLKALGFSDVKFIQDGIDAWKEKGYPVVSSVPAQGVGQ